MGGGGGRWPAVMAGGRIPMVLAGDKIPVVAGGEIPEMVAGGGIPAVVADGRWVVVSFNLFQALEGLNGQNCGLFNLQGAEVAGLEDLLSWNCTVVPVLLDQGSPQIC
ncbi:unnamed protein product [Prunus armeniaca]